MTHYENKLTKNITFLLIETKLHQFSKFVLIVLCSTWSHFMYWKLSQRSFFGRIEDTINCFRDLLKWQWFKNSSSKVGKNASISDFDSIKEKHPDQISMAYLELKDEFSKLLIFCTVVIVPLFLFSVAGPKGSGKTSLVFTLARGIFPGKT